MREQNPDRQTDRQTDRDTYRQTDRQTELKYYIDVSDNFTGRTILIFSITLFLV